MPARRLASAVLAALLLIPFIRFAPRYYKMTTDDLNWPDIALNVDSHQAAARINTLAHPTDTLFVWGYRIMNLRIDFVF